MKLREIEIDISQFIKLSIDGAAYILRSKILTPYSIWNILWSSAVYFFVYSSCIKTMINIGGNEKWQSVILSIMK